MKLVDKINEMHEKYAFPLSNRLLIPYIGFLQQEITEGNWNGPAAGTKGTGIGECTKTRMRT